jgi:hypothetical protein
MSHPFAYVELHSTNPDIAGDFYKRLFDWRTTTSPSPVGPYTEIETGEGLPGGMLTAQGGSASRWVVYVKVDDVEAATKKAETLGARVLAPKTLVPEAGWFTLCADPTGATFGLWQPLPADQKTK